MAVARASDARRWWPRQWAPDSGGSGSSTGSGADHGGLHLNRLQDGRTKYFVRAVTFCTQNNVIDNTVCAGQPPQAAVHTRRYLVHRISLVQERPGLPVPAGTGGSACSGRACGEPGPVAAGRAAGPAAGRAGGTAPPRPRTCGSGPDVVRRAAPHPRGRGAAARPAASAPRDRSAATRRYSRQLLGRGGQDRGRGAQDDDGQRPGRAGGQSPTRARRGQGHRGGSGRLGGPRSGGGCHDGRHGCLQVGNGRVFRAEVTLAVTRHSIQQDLRNTRR